MTWAPGISTITSRMGAIQNLLASRSTARESAPSFDDQAFAASTAGFDPFGAAYQQALVTSGVAPRPADTATTDATSAGADATVAAVGATSSTDAVTSGSPSAAAAMSQPFDLTVATRRPASAGSVVESTGGAASGAATGTYGGTSPGQVMVVGAPYPVVSGSGTSVGKVGGYGVMPVPAELAAYGNGRIPTDALETIGQGGHRLWGPAAESYKALVAAAKVEGIDLTVTDSYRTYDQQVQLAEQKGLYADGGLAAVPGTSNHGWGLAVDFNVNSPAALDWLQANGHSYGFVEAVRREPWHWEYRPSQA